MATSKGQLQAWLVEWVATRDESVRGPPNTWDVSNVTNMKGLFRKEELKEKNSRIRMLVERGKVMEKEKSGWERRKKEEEKRRKEREEKMKITRLACKKDGKSTLL